MDETLIGTGLARIERALQRAEGRAREVKELADRHRDLKDMVAQALRELDDLIAESSP